MATQAELEQVRRALNRLAQAAQGDLQAVWDQLKTSDRVQVSRALTEGWEWVLERYGNMAATLAADFFEVEARNLNLTPRVQMAAPFDGPRANARLEWALSTPNQWGNVTVLLDELVKQPYRSTFQDSAHASGGAWARVPTGASTCAFCRMTASRGAVYRSAQSAGEGKKWHGRCDCAVVLVRDERDYPKGYNPDALYDQYEAGRAEAQSGDPKKILSAMRAQAGTN